MTSEERRDSILASLKKSNSPLTGASLAKLYNVSRQIIVQMLQFFGQQVMISLPHLRDT